MDFFRLIGLTLKILTRFSYKDIFKIFTCVFADNKELFPTKKRIVFIPFRFQLLFLLLENL